MAERLRRQRSTRMTGSRLWTANLRNLNGGGNMNRLRPFLAFLLVCLLLSVPVLADDEPDGDPDDVPFSSEDVSSVPEDTAPAPDPALSPSEDIPPDAAAVPIVSAVDAPPPDAVPAQDASLDDYIPVYDTGGAIETFQTTTDTGTSVILVDVQSHDMLSVSSVYASDDPAYAMEDAGTDTDTDNSLVQAVRDLLGTYTPRTQTVTTYYDGPPLSVDEQIIPGLGGLDWEWITGACLFLLMLYCLFRLLGGMMRYG